jgi:hypothetical protein
MALVHEALPTEFFPVMVTRRRFPLSAAFGV